jgi:hypothetical protein
MLDCLLKRVACKLRLPEGSCTRESVRGSDLTIQDVCEVEVRLLTRVERRFSLVRNSRICLKAFANSHVSKAKLVYCVLDLGGGRYEQAESC